MRLVLPASLRPMTAEWEYIDYEAGTDWVEGEVDHLEVKFMVNWTQNPEFDVFLTGVVLIRNKASDTIEPEILRDDYWMEGNSDYLK